MTVEEKVLSKVRRILINDASLSAIISTNVYASHISSIDKPVYPAISLFVLSGGGAIFEANGFVNVNLQIDTWLPRALFNTSDILKAQDRIRSLLHRQSLADKTIPVAGFGVEQHVGPVMVEGDTKLIHLPLIYKFTAA